MDEVAVEPHLAPVGTHGNTNHFGLRHLEAHGDFAFAFGFGDSIVELHSP
jgi:hypothetical protein